MMKFCHCFTSRFGLEVDEISLTHPNQRTQSKEGRVPENNSHEGFGVSNFV